MAKRQSKQMIFRLLWRMCQASSNLVSVDSSFLYSGARTSRASADLVSVESSFLYCGARTRRASADLVTGGLGRTQVHGQTTVEDSFKDLIRYRIGQAESKQ